MHEHLSQTPDPVRRPRRHRWRPRLPALVGTCPGHRLQLWQGQAQAGVGQHEVVVYLEERQLLTQSRFMFRILRSLSQPLQAWESKRASPETELALELVDAEVPIVPLPLQHTKRGQAAREMMPLRPF